MIRIRKIAAFAVLLLFPFLLLASPKDYATACAEGIALWSKSVLPALFPFMVTASLLSKAGAAKISDRLSPLMRSLKLPAASSLCIFLSILSGYPVGSRCLLDMKNAGLISEKDTTRASLVCSTSGPMFLLGSVGVHAAMQGGAKFGQKALVTGAGCIGLVTAMALKTMGVSEVYVSDVLPSRLQKAKELGATVVINSKEEDLQKRIAELTGGQGVDLAVDTSGNEIAVNGAIECVKKGANIVLVGYSRSGMMNLAISRALDKEVTFKTVFRYRHVYPLAIQAVAEGKINLKGVVSDVFELDDVQTAMDRSVQEKAKIVKAVVHIG